MLVAGALQGIRRQIPKLSALPDAWDAAEI